MTCSHLEECNECYDKKSSSFDGWTGKRVEFIVPTKGLTNYHFLIPEPLAYFLQKVVEDNSYWREFKKEIYRISTRDQPVDPQELQTKVTFLETRLSKAEKLMDEIEEACGDAPHRAATLDLRLRVYKETLIELKKIFRDFLESKLSIDKRINDLSERFLKLIGERYPGGNLF